MRCCPLQEYVKARLLQFVGEPIFAKRMYQTAEGVQRAAKEVLTKLSIPAGKSLPDGASGAFTLLFRHECRFVQDVVEVVYCHRLLALCKVKVHKTWLLTVCPSSRSCLSSIVLSACMVSNLHDPGMACNFSRQKMTFPAGASGVCVQNVNFVSRLSTDGAQAASPQSTCLGMH